MQTNTQSRLKSISETSVWTAITAGILVTLIVGLLLDLLGMAIGLSLFSPTKGVLYSLSTGAVIWVLASTIAAMYIGGWIAGHFSPENTPGNGVLYGLMVSSISIFIFLGLTISGIGTLVNTSVSGLQYSISTVTMAAKESAPALSTMIKGIANLSPELTEKVKKTIPNLKPIVDKIQHKALELLASNNSTDKLKGQLENLISQYLDTIGNANQAEAREKLIAFLTEATGKSSEEISNKIDEWQNLYTDAEKHVQQTVSDTTKEATRTLGHFALLNFFIIISGIIAAGLGGADGIKRK